MIEYTRLSEVNIDPTNCDVDPFNAHEWYPICEELFGRIPPTSLADHIARLRGWSAVLVKVGTNDVVQGDPLRGLIEEP